ncbi:glycosyltransferase family 4 protein [Niastella caeni]|uniref:Glycosyltransferase family 4 protein n=1 Tax=Niastella caeni TaxID=2569763 RepID=A0A4S8I067_9BACT|nr:glycosyltransferase family 1 protein [Niastella caeni]THU41508.1 glycosyltransferase family 4 protein [Niastella caeni]
MENKQTVKPRVVFFHRRPRSVGNYSVEFIFEDVRKRLRDKIDAQIVVSKYESSGFFKRLYNCVEAWWKQGPVNHVTGDVNFLGLFLKRRATIQTILDCVHLNTSAGIKYKILKLFWVSIPERRCKYITAISESTKQEILRHHKCDPNKIVVIPVAISPKFKRTDKPFNKERPVILQVGTAPNKNIPNLIEAVKGLPCILNIIGKQNDEYIALLKKYGVEYKYEWGLTDEEIIQRYEQADIVNLVSTYEGFGMPILEAQAVGRAVITSNLFSMPEVAGDAAVMVDPFIVSEIRKGLEKIINNDSFRDDMIKRGFENIKRFDPDVIATQYLDLYKKIIV